MTESIRMAVLNFVHETVTFLPNDTALADFVYDGSPAKGEALLAWEPLSYMGGFVKVAREHAGVELVGIESPLWPRTGTGSGWITAEAYEHFLGRMITELEDGGKWHGVYLAVHGAMGVRGVARPEADIARRVRKVVGRDAFIAGTFDPHGNEDAEFLRQADLAFCAKYFPHYDSRLQGERAARMLIRAIRGDYIKSRVHFRRGFDDSSFAKTILLVEPEQPFLGTVRLEALPYRNVDISKFYPYGDVSFP